MQRIGIVTAGGDCPGLNAVIRGVVKTAQNDYGVEVFGIRDGFVGMVTYKGDERGKILTNRDASGILAVGGTILGTARGDVFEAAGTKEGDYSIFEEAFSSMKIDALICTGGDGTQRMAQKLHTHGFPVVGIPKTIDNDLMETDVTFGFNSAVTIIMEAIDNLHSTAMSHHRALVVEVMGRDVGWLALVAGVAGGGDVILIPETPYEEQAIFDCALERSRKGKRFSIVVVAEGVKPNDKNAPQKEIARYLSSLIEKETGIETRPVILGHLQRGGPPTAFDRILATQFAVKAVDLVMEGRFGEMAAIQGNDFVSVPISQATKGLKRVPLDHPLIRSAVSVGTSFGSREIDKRQKDKS
ncbi:6-phosphofructokinase [Candidatus Sumerlaeota bacterium]|nr:6-phosphofructokinase [Candidatus Sumerlaeota bacterium]